MMSSSTSTPSSILGSPSWSSSTAPASIELVNDDLLDEDLVDDGITLIESDAHDSEVDAPIDYDLSSLPESEARDSEDDAPIEYDTSSPPESPGPGTSPSQQNSPSPFRDSSPVDELFPDSYPLSPDLEGELELAILAEMEMDDHIGEHEGPPPHPRAGGNTAAQRHVGVARESPDELVDLDLYFRQPLNQRMPQNQQGPADVIDLTNEPDSPVQAHAPRPSVNPRRQNSQGRHPPALSRSDSSVLAGHAPVIDLTDDSPEVPRRRRPVPPPPPPMPRPRERNDFMLNPASAFSGLAAGLRRHLYPFRFYPGPDDEVQLLGILHNQINAGDLNNPLGPIRLQYEHGAFDRVASPKPVHQPPPPAKAGFTRDTGDDLVIICPSCNEELAYDPDDNQPAKKSGKRHRENHFWALKSCGHVYCDDCFENRKPKAKRNEFRRGEDGVAILCAVDGCETIATNKTSWVGIYL